jgi:hypothetical protein
MVAATTCAVMVNSARADLTVYANDREGWEAAVGSFSTADFVGLGETWMDPYAYTHLGVTMAESIYHGHYYAQDAFSSYPRDGAGLHGDGSLELLFDAPVYGVALDFNGVYRAEVYREGEFLGYMTGSDTFGTFTGFTSDISFDRVVLYDIFVDFLSIDDIHFGPPIPAPGSAVLVALAFIRRRRR